MPSKESRQNLMFSATFSNEVIKIASSLMNEFYFITTNNEFSANDNIVQSLFQTNSYYEKMMVLKQQLMSIKGSVISNYFAYFSLLGY